MHESTIDLMSSLAFFCLCRHSSDGRLVASNSVRQIHRVVFGAGCLCHGLLAVRAFQYAHRTPDVETTCVYTKLILREASSSLLERIFGVIGVRAAAACLVLLFICGTMLPFGVRGLPKCVYCLITVRKVAEALCGSLTFRTSSCSRFASNSAEFVDLPVYVKIVATVMCHHRRQRYLNALMQCIRTARLKNRYSWSSSLCSAHALRR